MSPWLRLIIKATAEEARQKRARSPWLRSIFAQFFYVALCEIFFLTFERSLTLLSRVS